MQVGISAFGSMLAMCGGAGNINGFTDIRALRPWIERQLKLLG